MKISPSLQFFIFILSTISIDNIRANRKHLLFTVNGIHEQIEHKNWTCVQIIQYFLNRCSNYNKKLNAIISYNQNALTEANELDKIRNKRHVGKLYCIPILVKDNIDVEGIPTTGGINALNNSIPDRSALIVERLKAEHAIIIAKTNLAEFASGSQYYKSEMGGECYNPWDTKRSCGVSSSGSGAGVASGMGVIGIGTDTDGSIIQPAAYNGLFGLRPPHEYELLAGIMPSFTKQDTVGPLTKHIDDLVLTHSIIYNNTAIVNEYEKAKLTDTKIRVGIFDIFLNGFNIRFNISSQTANAVYYLDEYVRNGMTLSLKKLEKLKNIQVVYMNMTKEDFKKLERLTVDLIMNRVLECGKECYKRSFNKYFSRLPSNAPFKSLEEMTKSPRLSEFWAYFFSLSANETEARCNQTCITYDLLRAKFNELLKTWLDTYNIDVLIVPSNSYLPEYVNESENIFNKSISATFLAAFSGYPALNIPIEFTKYTFSSPCGLPIGMSLLSTPQNLIKSFLIAHKYENFYLNNKKKRCYLPRGFQ